LDIEREEVIAMAQKATQKPKKSKKDKKNKGKGK
jgi:hypothetical protein